MTVHDTLDYDLPACAVSALWAHGWFTEPCWAFALAFDFITIEALRGE